MDIQLQSWQVLTLGLTASVLVWLLSRLGTTFVPWLGKLFKQAGWSYDPGRFVKTILVVLATLGLTWWWYPAVLPRFPDLVGTFGRRWDLVWHWIFALQPALLPFIGAATLIYNMALSYVTDDARRAAALKQFGDWLLARKSEPK